MSQRGKFLIIFMLILFIIVLGIWNDRVFSFAQFVFCLVTSSLALNGALDETF